MKSRGFTLIELLIVVVVAGILALMVYPSYEEQVRKARRADGKAAAAGLLLAQSKLRANCRFFAQSIGSDDDCQSTAASTVVGYRTTSEEGFYNLSIEASTASGVAYTIVADPTGVQADDTSCDPLKIEVNAANPNGLKTPTACW